MCREQDSNSHNYPQGITTTVRGGDCPVDAWVKIVHKLKRSGWGGSSWRAHASKKNSTKGSDQCLSSWKCVGSVGSLHQMRAGDHKTHFWLVFKQTSSHTVKMDYSWEPLKCSSGYERFLWWGSRLTSSSSIGGFMDTERFWINVKLKHTHQEHEKGS